MGESRGKPGLQGARRKAGNRATGATEASGTARDGNDRRSKTMHQSQSSLLTGNMEKAEGI